MSEPKLTKKQKIFADEYLVSLNGTQAAIKAGYSELSAREIGSENLTKPNIRAYIDARMGSKDDDRIARQDEVLMLLTAMARGQINEECVVVEGQGDGISRATKIEKKITPADRLKAINLLAKRYGIDKPEESNSEVGVIKFEFNR